MQIIVETIDGETIELNVKKTDTIDDVKAVIRKQGYAVDELRHGEFFPKSWEEMERFIPIFVATTNNENSEIQDKEGIPQDQQSDAKDTELKVVVEVEVEVEVEPYRALEPYIAL